MFMHCCLPNVHNVLATTNCDTSQLDNPGTVYNRIIIAKLISTPETVTNMGSKLSSCLPSKRNESDDNDIDEKIKTINNVLCTNLLVNESNVDFRLNHLILWHQNCCLKMKTQSNFRPLLNPLGPGSAGSPDAFKC